MVTFNELHIGTKFRFDSLDGVTFCKIGRRAYKIVKRDGTLHPLRHHVSRGSVPVFTQPVNGTPIVSFKGGTM